MPCSNSITAATDVMGSTDDAPILHCAVEFCLRAPEPVRGAAGRAGSLRRVKHRTGEEALPKQCETGEAGPGLA